MESARQVAKPFSGLGIALPSTLDREASLSVLGLFVRQMPGLVAVFDWATFIPIAASSAYGALLADGRAGENLAGELPEPLAAALKAALQELFSSGIEVRLPCVSFTPPGVSPLMERCFQVICTPLTLGSLETLALVTLEEVTELVWMQRRLCEAAETHGRAIGLLQQIAELLDDGVFICDATGTIRFANTPALQLVDMAGSALIGSSFATFVATLQPHSADGMPLDLASIPGIRVLHGEPATSIVIGLRTPNTSGERFVRSLALPIHDAHGDLLSVVVIWLDQHPGVEAERQKDAFLAIVGHELRTPLTALTGYVQLYERRLGRAGADRSRDLAMVHTISEQATRLVHLADDLLDLSRLTRGTLQLQYAPCNIIALARRVIEAQQITDPEHHLALQHSEASLMGVWDERRLEQVLNNLISNAIRYSPQGGPVEVRIAREAAVIRVSVRDEGIGVPAAQQPRLFERFYRAENAVLANFGGLGLGLSIARELIARHGGEIGVVSREGQGSTFWFTLPATLSVRN
jgi:signal transduction histidine kinase